MLCISMSLSGLHQRAQHIRVHVCCKCASSACLGSDASCCCSRAVRAKGGASYLRLGWFGAGVMLRSMRCCLTRSGLGRNFWAPLFNLCVCRVFRSAALTCNTKGDLRHEASRTQSWSSVFGMSRPQATRAARGLSEPGRHFPVRFITTSADVTQRCVTSLIPFLN
jgi:hypothetical protein